MSSVSCARAPTWRASSLVAACSARSAWRTATSPAISAPTSRTAPVASAARSRRLILSCRRACSSAACSSVCDDRLLAARKSSSVAVSVGGRAFLPVQGLGEATAAVELAVGAAEAVPGVGGDGEVVQDALAFEVVVEPAAQPRPGAGQRFVGELDDAVVAGDQPRGHQQVDHRVVVGAGDDRAAAAAGCGRLAVRTRARPGAAAGRAGPLAAPAGCRS